MKNIHRYDQHFRGFPPSAFEYVSRFATKEAADAATDESSSSDEVSSVDTYSDEDESPDMDI
ncbi:1548_t:CDS:2 [Racocetra fulgida]|uniref:1548_t:CDS:1 n=1 Tax=Racocetra fulgida TaxID=60492 RepID=A0A9N9EBV1_9GLOM|nr:1548_t:CDS:2 [Racocetra fulgida]